MDNYSVTINRLHRCETHSIFSALGTKRDTNWPDVENMLTVSYNNADENIHDAEFWKNLLDARLGINSFVTLNISL